MERLPKPGPVQPDLPALPFGKGCKPIRSGKKTFKTASSRHSTQQQPDLFALPLPPLPRSHFLPDEIRLSVVPAPEKIQPEGEDAFLYLVVSQDRAGHLMTTGLPINRRSPLMVTERSGIMFWLAKIADTTAGDSDTSPVVLRFKRSLVAQALEQDPDHTAEFSTPCYLLSGN